METSLSSTEAVRHFADVLARVKYGGENFLLTKSAQPVARLIPVKSDQFPTGAEIMEALARLPHDPDFAADLERVNRMDRDAENPWA